MMDKTDFLKKLYPIGTRLILDEMDDSQSPPKNTIGTVVAVDSMGTIHMDWDNGSSLGLIYGVDKFHKVK